MNKIKISYLKKVFSLSSLSKLFREGETSRLCSPSGLFRQLISWFSIPCSGLPSGISCSFSGVGRLSSDNGGLHSIVWSAPVSFNFFLSITSAIICCLGLSALLLKAFDIRLVSLEFCFTGIITEIESLIEEKKKISKRITILLAVISIWSFDCHITGEETKIHSSVSVLV